MWTASQRKYALSEKGKLSRKKYQEKRKARLLEIKKEQEIKTNYAPKTSGLSEGTKKTKDKK